MAIPGYDRQRFAAQLNAVVSPAQPIHSIEHLFGRTSELDRIEKALFAPGRHVFIYGDRGVGKSSLAATAANLYQSSDADYIDVSCSPDATFSGVIANVAFQALNASRLTRTQTRDTAGVRLRYLNLERASETSLQDLYTEIHNLIDAVEVLREVAAIHSQSPIVVVDEFDRMASAQERAKFADLLKHLGDKRIPLKFIFTGIAKTLDELLGAHQSAIRQLETIELPKLNWNARWNILLDAARAFSINVDRNLYVRVAAVSDGYPYYVHLITEKILWRVFEDPQETDAITWEHYHAALQDAIHSISAELKRPYEMAIMQRSGDYEEVLWSTADSEWLQRYLKDMYSSYLYIMRQGTKTPLDYEKYSSRIRNLRKPACGSILVSENKQGLYSYREKMLRGYVRMQAEAHGIELIGEQSAPSEKQVMRVPARASSGYFQSTIPPGVHFDRQRKHDGKE